MGKKKIEYDESRPTPYLLKSLKQSEKDYKEGRVSPAFDNAKDAIAWLNADHAPLKNGECTCGKKNCKKYEDHA